MEKRLFWQIGEKIFYIANAPHIWGAVTYFFAFSPILTAKCNNYKMLSHASIVCEKLGTDSEKITRIAFETIQGRINFHAARVAPLTINHVKPDQSNETWTHSTIQDLAALEHAFFPHLDLCHDSFLSGKASEGEIVTKYINSELDPHLGMAIAAEIAALRFVLLDYAMKFCQSVGAADVRNYFDEVYFRKEKEYDNDRSAASKRGALNSVLKTERSIAIMFQNTVSFDRPISTIINTSTDVCTFLPGIISIFGKPTFFLETRELLAKCPPGHATPDNFRTIFGKLDEDTRAEIRERIHARISGRVEMTRRHYRVRGDDAWKSVLDNLKEFERVFVLHSTRHYNLFHDSTENLSAEEIVAKYRSARIDPEREISIATGLLACRRILIDHVNDAGPGTKTILDYFKDACNFGGRTTVRFFYKISLKSETIAVDERPFSFLSELGATFGITMKNVEEPAVPQKALPSDFQTLFGRLDHSEKEKIKTTVNRKINDALGEFNSKFSGNAEAQAEKALTKLTKLEREFAPYYALHFKLSYSPEEYPVNEIAAKYGLVANDDISVFDPDGNEISASEGAARNDRAIVVARNIAVYRQVLLDYCARENAGAKIMVIINDYVRGQWDHARDIVDSMFDTTSSAYQATASASDSAGFFMALLNATRTKKANSAGAARDGHLDNIKFLCEMELLHAIAERNRGIVLVANNDERSSNSPRSSPTIPLSHRQANTGPSQQEDESHWFAHSPIVYHGEKANPMAYLQVSKFAHGHDVLRTFGDDLFKNLHLLNDISDSFVQYHMRLVKLSANFKLSDKEICAHYSFYEDVEANEIVRLNPREGLETAANIVAWHIFLLKFAKAHPNDESTADIVKYFADEHRHLIQIYADPSNMELSKIMALTDTIATIERTCHFLRDGRPVDDSEVEKFIAETNYAFRFILELHRLYGRTFFYGHDGR